jgi:simple sugar transport system permease protein
MKTLFQHQRDVVTLSFVLVAVFVLMSLLIPDKFLRGANLQSMAFQLPELGILALAMMITLLTGGINLSIITAANLSGIAAALIMTKLIPPGASPAGVALNIALAFAACVALSLILGYLNGVLIAYVGVSPILATLGTMTLYGGLSIVITKGYVISNFPKEFVFIGNGTVFGVPLAIIVFAVCAFAMSVLLNRKPFGFCVYMLGSNPVATEFSGIDVKSLIIKTYLLSGLYSGIASIVMISRFNSANAGYGASYLLVTVLLGVLGGVNPAGGFGKVSGLVLALLILQIISSGLNLLKVSTFVTLSLWGVILILVMAVNNLVLQRKGARRS